MSDVSLVRNGQLILERIWNDVTSSAETGPIQDFLKDAELVDRIRRSINSPTKTYRYVLPTQLLAKLANSSLDCRCLQAQRGGPGAFDARTLAHQVIVPFDRANHSVLGGSAEPYVSKPLRDDEISPAHRRSKKNRSGWDDLVRVLQAIQDRADPRFTDAVFRQVLKEIYGRLATVRVVYPVPRRISLERTMELIEEYVLGRSGGDRFQATVAALFQAFGKHTGCFDHVRRQPINAADIASGQIADIECVTASGDIVLVVEAKDRELTITQLQDKIAGLRESQVSEALFVAARGVAPTDERAIRETIDREFVSGQNLYVTELRPLARVVLALIGESGRRLFLKCVGEQLNQFSDLPQRRAWADSLRAL